MNRTYATLLLAILLSAPSISSAGSATPIVDARQAIQQRRIDHGVAAGQLTAPEAQRLEMQQDRIARREARYAADGVVTTRERVRLHRAQDRASRNIRRLRHD